MPRSAAAERGTATESVPAGLRLSDFHYELPAELIARYPPRRRRDSRLLIVDGCSGSLIHGRFPDIAGCIGSEDLLVLNDTRVMAARFAARRPTGGRAEILIERLLSEQQVLAWVGSSRKLRCGDRLELLARSGAATAHTFEVVGRREALFELRLHSTVALRQLMARLGQVPLPPYLGREAEPLDKRRYQTLYARHDGAVAAPTAGLHFDRRLLDHLRQAGTEIGFLTLHVGAGTFEPVRCDDLREHQLHAERLQVSQQLCAQLEHCRHRGGRVFAVGTTVVRALESLAARGPLRPFVGETRLFIRPGYKFALVDALLSNFHLPDSTLLPLVAAFAGRETVLGAYREAVRQCYRFYSYGDAMLLMPPRPESS